MQPKYEVPIIPHNLRREESIIQIAEALQYLSTVSTDIFNRIDARIAQNKEQVNKISTRIAAAQTKLNKLAGAKKATQVFSSCKYPAEGVNRPYESIFKDCPETLPVKKFPHEYKRSHTGDEQAETLQFYYVKVKDKQSLHNDKGLVEVPTDIETINDLLLFNTGRNAYSKEAALDKSNTSYTSASKKEKDDNESDIGAAPYSLLQGQGIQRNVGENYFYAPHLGNVPTIDVPLDLPDLPGIADDLRYHIEQEPIIAPSVTHTLVNMPSLPNLPDLPEINDDIKGIVKTETIENVLAKTEVTAEILQEVKIVGEKVEAIITAEEKIVQEPKPIEQVKVTPVVSELPVDNIRASLMDAIRKAGGAKNLKQADTSNSEKHEPTSTGDLMADLHAKLSLRRKGISGNKPDQPSAMDKISAMIPPPPQADNTESTEEEDWDD